MTMERQLGNMKTTHISFEIDLPPGVTDEAFVEWIQFEVGLGNVINQDNPLEYCEIRNLAKNIVIKELLA